MSYINSEYGEKRVDSQDILIYIYWHLLDGFFDYNGSCLSLNLFNIICNPLIILCLLYK